MKIKKNLPLLVFLAIVLALFVGYRTWKTYTTDVTPPVITYDNTVMEISVHDDQSMLLAGVTASDDCDGDVSNSLMIEKIGVINEDHAFVVTVAAFDTSGNVTKVRRNVRYVDYESPKFDLASPLLFLYGRDVNVTSCITANDLIDGDISQRIKFTALSDGAITAEGVHDLMFRVTNSRGDTSELIIPIEVYPAGDYNATLLLSDYLVYIPTGESFDAKEYLQYYKYDDTSVFLGSALPPAYRLTTRGVVDTSKPGVYPVSYTLSYTVDKYTYTAYSKLIVIVEG